MGNQLVTQDITVEFVNDKPKYPKFSNGSLKLSDGRWMSVATSIPIHQFAKGSTYNVGVSTNAKGYESIEAVGGVIAGIERPAAAATPSVAPLKTRDFDREARGKTKCAISEAILSNPAVDPMSIDLLALETRVNAVTELIFK